MLDPLAVTVAEAARLLSVSRATVFRLLSSGRLRRMAGVPRVTRESIDALLTAPPSRARRPRPAAFVPVDVDRVLRVVQVQR